MQEREAGQVKRLMSTRFLHISLFPAVTEGNGQNIVPARYMVSSLQACHKLLSPYDRKEGWTCRPPASNLSHIGKKLRHLRNA